MFIILLALASVFNGCSVWPDDTFYIISTPGEQIEIRLNEIFRNSMNKQYKVIPSSPLYSILTPLTLIQKSQYNSQEPREILAQKLYKSSGFMDLSNQMTILSKVQNNYFIEYNSILFEYTPDIDVVKLLNVKPNSICYDTVQVDQKYVVECNDADGDYFAILSQDQTQFFTIQNSQRQQRKLDQLDNLILRNLYYSLELYQVQDDGIVLLSTLNTQYLRLLTKDDEFTLLVVDFQFHTNSQITILNQKGQFISLKYIIQSQKWELYEYLQTETTLPYAYDFSWKYLQLVIISENTLYLRSLSDWTVNGKLTIEPKDKVFLTQNYIILQKEKSLYILNQYLKQIQTLQTQTQGFLISYQAYDQFTLFDKQYFQTYAVDQANEQILKFQSNQLTDDYTMFTIQQQLFYTICQIKCYYKVVDVLYIETKFQYQVPNQFHLSENIIAKDQQYQ